MENRGTFVQMVLNRCVIHGHTSGQPASFRLVVTESVLSVDLATVVWPQQPSLKMVRNKKDLNVL